MTTTALAPTFDVRTLDADDLALAERLALAPDPERARILDRYSDEQLAALRYDWEFWGRPDQQEPPPGWLLDLVMGGRGSGKTRTGSEITRRFPQRHRLIALVAANAGDARDVMVEGPSGILRVSPPGERPLYEPSKRRLTWPNGAQGHIYSDADPEDLRGFEGSAAWVDEFGKYRHPETTWSNLNFAMRSVAATSNPQRLVTTTPRSVKAIRDLVDRIERENKAAAMAGRKRRMWLRRQSTYRNRGNLAADYLAEIIDQYEGTRLGAQEIHGLLLEDVEGALWTYRLLEDQRYRGLLRYDDQGHEVPATPLYRIGVAVDPPGSKRTECGIVVGAADRNRPKNLYVLDDRSMKGSPAEWGRAVVRAAHDWRADVIVVERNYGGDMVAHTIRTVEAWTDLHSGERYPAGDTYRIVDARATRGKEIRAEPVVGKYAQRRVWHVGHHPALEDELRTWVPAEGMKSPNRLDALVWLVWHLLLHAGKGAPARGDVEDQTSRRIDTGVPRG